MEDILNKLKRVDWKIITKWTSIFRHAFSKPFSCWDNNEFDAYNKTEIALLLESVSKRYNSFSRLGWRKTSWTLNCRKVNSLSHVDMFLEDQLVPKPPSYSVSTCWNEVFVTSIYFLILVFGFILLNVSHIVWFTNVVFLIYFRSFLTVACRWWFRRVTHHYWELFGVATMISFKFLLRKVLKSQPVTGYLLCDVHFLLFRIQRLLQLMPLF